uniref:Testis cDNA clone: QtsA-11328, similar to human G protein-coupled receptor 85 (GPR85) n=1 Tax=Macaca fascicularis TaxID=9541 RepID=Q4R8W0_MACFA|nr:unnamed protein product [Macaca fascicularis]
MLLLALILLATQLVYLKLIFFVLISILLVKDKSLHRAPYYFLLDLCCSDILRSAICFPFVFNSVKNGSTWTYGTLTCKVIAFLGVLSCFHTAFMLFCISVTRYLAIAHHRFYTKRLTFWTCLAVICMVWTLSVAMAFPPVLDVGTYSFIREEDQCTFLVRCLWEEDGPEVLKGPFQPPTTNAGGGVGEVRKQPRRDKSLMLPVELDRAVNKPGQLWRQVGAPVGSTVAEAALPPPSPPPPPRPLRYWGKRCRCDRGGRGWSSRRLQRAGAAEPCLDAQSRH